MGNTMTRRSFVGAGASALTLAALSSGLGVFKETAQADEGGASAGSVTVPGCCHSCHFGSCTLDYTVQDGVLVNVEGNEDGPFNKGKICPRGLSIPNYVYNPYRVKAPLVRTNPEKGIDVDPGWKEISWDEAVDLLVEKMKAVYDTDPRKFVWMSGFAFASNYVTGTIARVYPPAFGTPNSTATTGNTCSVHLSAGLVQGGFVMWPDYDLSNYVIAIGGGVGPNHGGADGDCDVYMDCIERGCKFVHVDPFCTQEASKGEWVPIRPASDLPFVLALGNVILYEIGKVDEWYLKNRSNACYLIAPEGNDYVRDAATGKPCVWDTVKNAAVPFDSGYEDCALEGTFVVDGQEVRPGFAWVKDAYREFTPEWAEEICTVPAETIRRLANEFVEAAQIGATIEINGETMPYRPACVYVARGLTNHRDGHMAMWAAMLLNQMVGAVGVPGGNLVMNDGDEVSAPDEDGVVKPHSHAATWHKFQMPPKSISAAEFLPFSFDYGMRTLDVIQDPEAYGVDYMPEVLVFEAAGLFTKGAADVEHISAGLRKIPFIATVAYHIDETAMFADLVLPDNTFVEQSTIYDFNGNIRPGNMDKLYVTRFHKKIIDPVYGWPTQDDMWIDVAERVGFLYGMGKFNFILSKARGLQGDYQLDPNTKYTAEEIIDRRLRTLSGGQGLDDLANVGYIVQDRGEHPETAYTYHNFPGRASHHPFYNMIFKQAGEDLLGGLAAAGMKHPGGLEEDIEFYYQGVPVYKPTPTQTGDLEEFDLWGSMRRYPLFMFDLGGVQSSPWLREAADENPWFGSWLINPATAERKGLKDGDMIYVEGQFGGRVGPHPVRVTELCHPDTLAVLSGLGREAAGMNPDVRKGIAYNQLMPRSWDAVDVFTGGTENSPRLKVIKA